LFGRPVPFSVVHQETLQKKQSGQAHKGKTLLLQKLAKGHK